MMNIDQVGNIHVESLVRLLALRDVETEEHTRRVTSLVLQLARLMNIRGRELSHMWRGAMLHDIGKIGIPDEILRKTDCLTPEERILIQMHPVYAYQLLDTIPYLRGAVDIPYCHHEHWDGTGYPRGLAGKQIPLSARLFAVVDVWDALLSDRPYHQAWKVNTATAYLREQTGVLFDPEVVPVFIDTLAARHARANADLIDPRDMYRVGWLSPAGYAAGAAPGSHR